MNHLPCHFNQIHRQLVKAVVRFEIFGVCAAIALFAPSAALARNNAMRPNVILILADDLGYTDLACYGSTFYETPNIDRLAASGVRFTDGYTCGPNCQPTRAALMSGQYGPRTGVYTVGSIDRFNWQSRRLRPVDNVVSLPLEKITLAQALRQSGYATGMFGKWHLGHDAEYHPARRGFDEAIVSQGRHFDFATDPTTEYPSGAYLADFLTDRAVDFVRRHQDKPFFLYLPHFGVHGPHEAKEQLIARFRSKPAGGGHSDPTYAAMIASLDESVGRIVALLDELKLAENTLVIFTSDNGGVGGYEREGIQGNSITDNAPLKGGKGMLYEGGIRVPYIFRMPGSIPSGKTCGVPIISVDLYPTVLEITRSPAPQNYHLDGASYAGLLSNPSAGPQLREPLYWHFPGYLGSGGNTWRTTPGGAIRQGDWKLIEYFEDDRFELYNLKDDVGEKLNLTDRHPEKVKSLSDKLVAWRKSTGALMPTPNRPSDAAAPDRAQKKKRRARRGAMD